MKAKVFDFNAVLPSIIYWDSSFIINFCVEGARYFEACKGFITRLSQDKVTSIISNLTLDEVWYGLLRVSLMEDYDTQWLNIYRKKPEVISNYIDIIKKVTKDLRLLPNLIIAETTTEMSLNALELMDKFSLFPRDAIHLSTFTSLGIKSIVTTDLDFTRVEDINVYTCHEKAFGES